MANQVYYDVSHFYLQKNLKRNFANIFAYNKTTNKTSVYINISVK